jgi:hypothetical protein
MVINEKEESNHWRRIACILALLWGILLSVNIHFYMRIYTEQNILTPTSTIALYGATIVGCILLIMFPLQFYIYTFLCCLWGILNIAEGGSVFGVLLYGLGLFFAWKKGFFAARLKIKLSLAGIPLIAALFSQLRYGGTTFLESCIDIFGLFTITAIVAFLAQHELQNLRKNKTELVDIPEPLPVPEPPRVKILTLPCDQFKYQDVAVAQGILAGKKYATIASEQDISLITVKRRSKKLFAYTNVTNELSFMNKYEGYTVELGKEEHPASLTADIKTLPAPSLARPA